MKPSYLRLRSLALFTAALFSIGLFTACSEEDDDDTSPPASSVPTTYNFSDYAVNAADATRLTTSLGELVTEMKKGRTPGTAVSADALRAIYTAGSPSLSDITTPYYRGVVNAAFDALADASGSTLDPNTPGSKGTYGVYLFAPGGLEPEQVVEKGLFAAALYHRTFVTELSGAPAAANWDRAFALYAADPSFPNNSKDKFSSQYAARRDNAGFYRAIRDGFLQGRVAINDGRASDRDANRERIRQSWEKAIGATIINYCYSATDRLSKTEVTDADRAAAWHALGEAVGFAHGWRQLPAAAVRTITDAQVERILTLLRAPVGGAPAIETFKTPADLQNLQTVVSEIAAIYSFGDPTIFKINDVQANNRGKLFAEGEE